MADLLDSYSPWFYEFDLGPLGRTKSLLPPEVRPIHATRLLMINDVIDRNFPTERLQAISCLDVACHEGFFSVELAKRGVKRVLGVDVREESLIKAQYVRDVLGLHSLEFRKLNAEQVKPETVGEFELTLFLGLLYHLENPILCLRNVYAVTKDLCILETQVIDDIAGSTEWGARAWTRDFQGVLALIDETPEFNAKNRETGATPLAICPSRKALVKMLEHVGFKRVEYIEPPVGAYEQFARGRRVVCAAYKHSAV
jgi:ubiquinone/menaquinone biosynthesis C-methylase UbiE